MSAISPDEHTPLLDNSRSAYRDVLLPDSPAPSTTTIVDDAPDTKPCPLGPHSRGTDGHWEPPTKNWIYVLQKQDMALRKNRTLVVCFDGTGDSFDNDHSNVVQFVSMLRKDDHGVNTSGNEDSGSQDHGGQMVYYQPGIGTYMSPLLVAPFVSTFVKTLDEMVAWNLGLHVMEAGQFCEICEDSGHIQSEALETLHDSLAPIYDQLDRQWFWKVMEYVPMQTKRQTVKDESKSLYWTINRGRGRKIFKHIMQRKLLVHPSVRYRLAAANEDGQKGTYVPRARPNLAYDKVRAVEHAVHHSTSGWWIARMVRRIRKRFRRDKAQPLTNREWVHGSEGPHPWYYWETQTTL